MSPHLGKEALAVFETPHRTPYAFNLHVQDVGHTLVLGATGAGKSFALNFLIAHAQKYAPQTVVLDVGHSYRKLATLLGGQYLELGLRQRGTTINPFALAPTPEHLHFLHAFVRVLLEGGDGYPVDRTNVYLQIIELRSPTAFLLLVYGYAALWERRDGGRNVTFPARQYSVNGERRSFALLRPANGDARAQEAIRQCILKAYQRSEAHT